MLILVITGDALWLPDVTAYMLPCSGKTAYIYNIESEEVKASTNYSLCVSTPKEVYIERKHTPRAVKRKGMILSW